MCGTQTWTVQVLRMGSLLPRETLKQISFCKNYTLIIVYMNNIIGTEHPSATMKVQISTHLHLHQQIGDL